MSITLTEQTIAFIMQSGGTTPETSILAGVILTDSGIISAQNASQGNDMIVELKHFYNGTVGNSVQQSAFLCTFLVSATTATSIIAGIPALKTRVQAQSAQISDVVTWGNVIAYG